MYPLRAVPLLALLVPALVLPAAAKVDLVTLPARDRVQLTIYNSADLTLVRDRRELTLRPGENRLQFSWAGTLIDPTSLELVPLAEAAAVAVQDLEYPPRVRELGIWNVTSERVGSTPMEISYFTSGVAWSAYYRALLNPAETAMTLEGYVRVDNRSGEDYADAETRLVVGKVNLLDRIADLARRAEPYGRPGPVPRPARELADEGRVREAMPMMRAAKSELAMAAPKEIRKEALSEYFLYSIEGTEDIADGWGTRLISLRAEDVPVTYLYRYEEERYGARAVRFLSFVNDRDHNLGTEPLPGGAVQVFRSLGEPGALGYVASRSTRYVPKGEEVDLELGHDDDVVVKATLMRTATDNYEWDRNRATDRQTITGWDQIDTYEVELANHRQLPVRVEVRRNFPTSAWELETEGEAGDYARVDADTVQYTQQLPPRSRRTFRYTVVLHLGSRARP